MATTRTPARKTPARSPAARRRAHAATGRTIATWAGRHMLTGCRICAVWTGRRTKGVATRTTHRIGGAARTWSRDKSRFGWSTPVATCGACGGKFPAHRQAQHPCNTSDTARTGGPFSGEQVRAEEPVRATAVRIDREVATTTSPRRGDGKGPEIGRMSRREFAAYARELNTRRRDAAVEHELYRAAGTTPPSEFDDATPDPVSTAGPETSAAPAVATPSKEITMHDPTNWAQHSEVLADPGINSTDELIEFLDTFSRASHTLYENLSSFADLMKAANVEQGVITKLQAAHEAAVAFTERLNEAHWAASDVYGDVPYPDFSKAS